MSKETPRALVTRLFVCCLEFRPTEDAPQFEGMLDEDVPTGVGTFHFVVEAVDTDDAATRCRARLHEISATDALMASSIVHIGALIELPRADLSRGLIINLQTTGAEYGEVFHEYLPEQSHSGASAEIPDEPPPPAAGFLPREDLRPVLWARWRLYWCDRESTGRFVVGRTANEAADFHEALDGYGHRETGGALICELPASLQDAAERNGVCSCSDETLLACGAEIDPSTRTVRIGGRVYDGDLVLNTATVS